MHKRTQDLKDYFHDAGLFYWASTETWLQKKPIISKNSTIVEIPLHRAIDIDDEQDWQLAELLHSSKPALEN